MGLVIIATVASMLRDPFDVNGELAAGPSPPPNAASAASGATVTAADDWLAYGGTGYGQRYSSLTDITPQTVGRLKLAWTFHTGDMKGPDDPIETTFEDTPLKVGDTLYLCTVHQHVIALDAATGKERRHFNPKIKVGHTSQHLSCCGLGYHDASVAAATTSASAAASASAATFANTAAPSAAASASATSAAAAPACTREVFLPTIDGRLFALDAGNGQPCADFGKAGVVQLATQMGDLKPGYYMQASPPVVSRDVLIIGSSINDNESIGNPSGVIRAFDVRTGRLVWNWDLSHPDATTPLPAGQKYTSNTPPSWAGGSVDEKLGLVYMPLGNQSPDQVGEGRGPEVEYFSRSIVALEVATGKLRRAFQGVHHDLWDRDFPAQPSLIDLTVSGATVPALIAPTKQGEVYVLDRCERRYGSAFRCRYC